MSKFTAERKVFTNTGQIRAAATRVFPLLCPTREYQWIETWECDLIYSTSGFAEKNCIFTTNFDGLTQFWSASRFCPEKGIIEFTIFIENLAIMLLQVSVVDTDDCRSEITWTRTFTGLNKKGNLFLKTLQDDDFQLRSNRLNKQLDHFLFCGEMLKAES